MDDLGERGDKRKSNARGSGQRGNYAKCAPVEEGIAMGGPRTEWVLAAYFQIWNSVSMDG
jgi:hypothetical protein